MNEHNMKCLMCGDACAGPVFTIKDRLKLDKRNYDVYRCKFCKTLMIFPFPDEEEIQNLYPQDYNFKISKQEKGIKGVVKNFEWNIFYKNVYSKNYHLIKKKLNKDKFSILDVGCGSGLRLNVFKEFGCDVEGNETSTACTEYIRKQLDINVHQGKLEEINFKGKTYDVVTMFALLEHLTEPSKTIVTAGNLLKNDGLLVIQTPVIDTIQYEILNEKAIMIREMPRHIFIPSIKGLKLFMENSGFELVSFSPVSLLECAASFSLGLYEASSAAAIYKNFNFNTLLHRSIGWLLTIFPGFLVGSYEILKGIGMENIFFFKKTKEK